MSTDTILSSNKMRTPLWIFLWTALCFGALSFHIDSVPPYHTDENFYVESVRNMVETGDYITPVYQDKKRFAKPPFYYWISALNYKLLGQGHVSARLVSTFMGAVCIAVTFFLTRRLFDESTGWLSAFILPGLYLHFQISRWAITDMTMALFILSAFYCCLLSVENNKVRIGWLYLFYFFIGLGFLTKGPPAVLIPASALILYRLLQKEKIPLREFKILQGLALILAMNLPWFLTMWILHGDEFKEHILGAEIKNRIVHDLPFSFYYFGVLIRYNLPWSLFFISALYYWFGMEQKKDFGNSKISLLEKIRLIAISQRKNPARLFCLAWIFAPILVFTLFRIEHSRYLLPLAPALAALLAHFFITLKSQPMGFQTILFKIPFYVTLIIYELIAILCAIAIWALHPLSPTPFAVFLLPLLLLPGTILLVYLHRSKTTFRLILALGVLQIILLSLGSGSFQSYINRSPMQSFAEVILEKGSGKEDLALFQASSNRARLGIMTAQSAYNFENPEGLKNFIQTPGRKFIVLKKEDWQNIFSKLPLRKIAEDQLWKNKKRDKGWIKKVLLDGTLKHKDELLETYYLLSTH